MSSPLFATIRTRGPAWQSVLPLDRQAGWDAHASFMNALARDGFVVIGGPMKGTDDVLLIIRAGSPDEVRARLESDPWTRNDLLRIKQISPWTLRLGSLNEA